MPSDRRRHPALAQQAGCLGEMAGGGHRGADLQGYVKRAAAGGGVNQDGGAIEDGGGEARVFGGHRVGVGPGGFLEAGAFEEGDRGAVGGADGGEAAGGEVDVQIEVLTEEAHAAFLLEGDAAGGEGGDAAVGEADAGVGDVVLRGGDGGADGVDGGDGAVDEGEHEVDVMDHQVKHDGDIGAAGFEGRDADAFDIERVGQAGGDGGVFGGVAQEMADLQDEAVAGGEGGHFVGFGEGGGDGFFDEDVFAGGQRLQREAMMQGCGGGDDNGVRRGEEAIEGQGGAADLGCDGGGPGGGGVVQAGEGCARVGGDFLGMKAAEMAGADDADAQRGGHGQGSGSMGGVA